MADKTPVTIAYFSDILCIWAYVAQIRLDEIGNQFRDDVETSYRFCSVFGNAADKISRAWADKGGFEGFNRHLKEIGHQFGHIEVHPDVWLATRPASSDSAHLFIKAMQLLETDGAIGPTALGGAASVEFIWRLRCAFFRECRDVSTRQVQRDIADQIGIRPDLVEARIDSGAAFAALAADRQETFVLNEGRQKLYGNLGYRVIEANVRELLRTPRAGEMSWC